MISTPGKVKRSTYTPLGVLLEKSGGRVQNAAYWANTQLGTTATTFDEISADGEAMMVLAYERYRTDPIYRAIIDVMVNAVLGSDGGNFELDESDSAIQALAAESGIGADILRDKLYAALSNTRGLMCGVKQLRHSKDVSGRMTIMQLNRMALTELFNVGEALTIKVKKDDRTYLQFIPRRRVIQIDRDDYGAIKGYWISTRDYKHKIGQPNYYGAFVNSMASKKQKKFVPASSAIWMCNREDADQLRGNGVLWCSLHIFQDIAAVVESSTACWDSANRYVMAIEGSENPKSVAKAIGAAEPITVAEKARQLTTYDAAVDAGETPEPYRQIIEDDAGQTLVLGQGNQAKVLDKNGIPNDRMGDHVMFLIRLAISPLHIDAASGLMANFEKVNYSAARAANDMKRSAAEAWQPYFLEAQLLPQQRWHLRCEMAASRLPIPMSVATMLGVLECGQWILQTPTVNAKEATETDKLDIELGMKSKGATRRGRNVDPTVLQAEIVADVLLDQGILNQLTDMGVDIGDMTAVKMNPYFTAAMGKTEAAVIAGQEKPNENAD